MGSKCIFRLPIFGKILKKPNICEISANLNKSQWTSVNFSRPRHFSLAVNPFTRDTYQHAFVSTDRNSTKPARPGCLVCCSYSTVTSNDESGTEEVGIKDVESKTSLPLKTMHKTLEEHHLRLLQTPDQPEDAHCLKVALIGSPNAGKSTLTNALLGWRVSSVSSKVHTTRSRINAVLTEGNKQLVFLDTPGMIHPGKRKKHNLEHSLIRDPYSSLYQADIIAVVVDVSVPWVSSGIDKQILKALTLHEDRKSILILNKVDLLQSKQKLLHLTRFLTEGVIDGKEDSFVVKATTKKRVSQLLQEENTNELFKKHSMERKRRSLSNKSENDDVDAINENDRNQISEDDLNNDSSTGADIKIDENDIWNAGGFFTGLKVVSAMPERKLRKGALPVHELRSWEEYAQALQRANESVRDRQGWNQFKQVFMVSSTEQDGVEDLRDYLEDQAAPGDWLYHSSVVTDQTPVDIIKHCIWEKLLDNLPKDIPYNLQLELEMLVDEGSIFRIVAKVICPTDRHIRCTMGRGGKNITHIALEAKQALMNTFKCDISLMLVAKLVR